MRLMRRFTERLRSLWRRVAGVERVADDLPPEHAGPAPSDLLRTLPPGGGSKL
jgi:hypothetical protein